MSKVWCITGAADCSFKYHTYNDQPSTFITETSRQYESISSIIWEIVHLWPVFGYFSPTCWSKSCFLGLFRPLCITHDVWGFQDTLGTSFPAYQMICQLKNGVGLWASALGGFLNLYWNCIFPPSFIFVLVQLTFILSMPNGLITKASHANKTWWLVSTEFIFFLCLKGIFCDIVRKLCGYLV